MLAEKRYEEILKILEAKGGATAVELTKAIGASEATIRRDISALAKMGKLKKVFGGATKVSQQYLTHENDMRTKVGMNISEKELIAKYCASLVEDGDCVYLDAGSTTLMMINYLRQSKALFVTSGLAQAQKLMQLDLKAYIVAGALKKQTDAIIGGEAVNCISKFNFTKAFIGANGVSVGQGFTTPDMEEGAVKQRAIAQSAQVYFLVDSSKFGKVCTCQIAGISGGTIVTDEAIDKSYQEYTKVVEVTL